MTARLRLVTAALSKTRLQYVVSALIPALVLSAALQGLAQDTAKPDASKPEEPEYANAFYLHNPDGTLKPLERQPVGVGTKVSMLGFGGGKALYEIQNEHSTLRIPASAVELAVKLEKNDVDPATVVVLYPLKVAKGKRQLLITGVGFMGMHSKSDLQSKQIQMNFTKYGQGSLNIIPANPLPPGEYAITVQAQGQQPTAYCFGID